MSLSLNLGEEIVSKVLCWSRRSVEVTVMFSVTPLGKKRIRKKGVKVRKMDEMAPKSRKLHKNDQNHTKITQIGKNRTKMTKI